MRQTYTHKFQCSYQLRKYPFDKQTCSIDMKTTDLDKYTMRIQPDQLGMLQSSEMTLFHMGSWKLDYMNKDVPEEGIAMTIVLKRKITSEMLTTFLPSFLLLMITFATTFFKPFFFEAALSVNLTTMLVMTTIFISVMEKLPLTSYPKMIDFWLIFCQLVPFAEVISRFMHHHLIISSHHLIFQVILLTAMEYMREDADGQKQGKAGYWTNKIKTFGKKILVKRYW